MGQVVIFCLWSILGVFQLFGEANVMMVKEYPRMSVLVIKESISQESYVLIPIVSLARRSLHDRCWREGRRSRGMCDLTTPKFLGQQTGVDSRCRLKGGKNV